MMFWLANIWCAVCVLVGCSASGMVLDLASDVLPEGVEAFYGTFSNGGVYRFIRGVEDLITEIRYGDERIYYLSGREAYVIYSHVEEFICNSETYIRFYFGLNVDRGVVFGSHTVQIKENKIHPIKSLDFKKVISGPILLSVDTTQGMLHPLVVLSHGRYCEGSATYNVIDRVLLDTGFTVRMQLWLYKVGEIRVSHINETSLRCISIFRMACKKFITFMQNQYFYIRADNKVDVQIDISHIIKMNPSQACNTSSSSSASVSCGGSSSSSVVSESTSQLALLSGRIGEGNHFSTADPSNTSTRSIYLLVPSRVYDSPLFEEYATYDASSNTVIYDMLFLIAHLGAQGQGKSRITIHLTAIPAVVRSNTPSVVSCDSTDAAPNSSGGNDSHANSATQKEGGTNESGNLDNSITEARAPHHDELGDVLAESDNLLGEQVPFDVLQTMSGITPPTPNPDASNMGHAVSQMDCNVLRGSGIGIDASEAPTIPPEMSDGVYSTGMIHDEYGSIDSILGDKVSGVVYTSSGCCAVGGHGGNQFLGVDWPLSAGTPDKVKPYAARPRRKRVRLDPAQY
ncbi:hypothetical protein, conserved [Babesia ovata]|uniref:Uncharacterized protein n=1 Tax=Babesia ovata TaxID=189622 RepID=A0A2H6KHR9_9APIC|nr:uncharacterized protein BOVATA_040270 [Babesia ovata]GBE62534.1 hypothetical protein, conserved [Babesia ovata]